MIELPENSDEAKAQLRQEFDKLKNTGLNVTQAIKQLVERCGGKIKERTLWKYKVEWDGNEQTPKKITASITKTKAGKKTQEETIPTKVARLVESELFRRPIENVKWLDPTATISDEDIRGYVIRVCNEISIGKGLMQVLDSMGISLFLFERWTNKDDELNVMYTKAMEQHQRAFMVRTQEAMKNVVMLFLSQDEITEETLMYEFMRSSVTKEGETQYVEVPKYRTLKKKPAKPDSQTVKVVFEMMKEINRANTAGMDDDLNRMLAMSESELEQVIHEMKLERDKRNEHQNRTIDERGTEQADQTGDVPADAEDDPE